MSSSIVLSCCNVAADWFCCFSRKESRSACREDSFISILESQHDFYHRQLAQFSVKRSDFALFSQIRRSHRVHQLRKVRAVAEQNVLFELEQQRGGYTKNGRKACGKKQAPAVKHDMQGQGLRSIQECGETSEKSGMNQRATTIESS